MENQKKSTYQIGNISAEVISDVYDGKILDTQIKIGGQLLCVVSGEERLQFIGEINEVIKKYRI